MEENVNGRKFYDNGRNCGVSVDCGNSFLVGVDWVWNLLAG